MGWSRVEVWGVRTTTGGVGGRRNGMRNCQRTDLEGDKEWTVKKIKDSLKQKKTKQPPQPIPKKDVVFYIFNFQPLFCSTDFKEG